MVVGMLQMQRAESVDFYRAFGVLHHIEEIIRLYEIPNKGTKWTKYFQVLDVLFIDRRFVAECKELIKAAKSHGIKIWIDLDDDLFNIPPYHDALYVIGAPNVQEAIKEAISAADVVTVTTPALKSLYGDLNPNVVIIPSAWNDYAFDQMPTPMDRKRKPRIAWRGSNTHRRDIFEVHQPVNKFIDKFAWSFYGMMPDCIEPNVMHVPFQDLQVFFSTFARNAPDYVLIPLSPGPFNQAKSNIAWMEAAVLAGACAIAPAGFDEFAKPGVIQYSGTNGLGQVFANIQANKYDRPALVRASQEYIRANLRLSEVNQMRVNILNTLVAETKKPELATT